MLLRWRPNPLTAQVERLTLPSYYGLHLICLLDYVQITGGSAEFWATSTQDPINFANPCPLNVRFSGINRSSHEGFYLFFYFCTAACLHSMSSLWCRYVLFCLEQVQPNKSNINYWRYYDNVLSYLPINPTENPTHFIKNRVSKTVW